MVRLAIDDSKSFEKFQKELNSLISRIKEPAPAFKRAKIIMKRDVLDHFRDQRGPKAKWRKLSEITKEMRKGKKGNEKILQDTGRLRQSIASKSYSNGAEVGTNVEYAEQHQFGGKSKFKGRFVKVPKRQFLWLSKDAEQKILDEFIKELKEA